MTRRRVTAISLVAAAVGLATLIVGLIIDPSRAWFAYLTAWTFGTTVCIGALILLMVGHASKGAWMVVLRRPTEAVVDALPLCLLLFVPICFGLRHIYPWAADPSSIDPALRAAIDRKRGWLNDEAFIGRSFLYLLEFNVVGVLLRAWSRSNDDRPRARLVVRMRRLSGGALPLVALTLTWAAFDWTMSLEPDWWSTIYGLYYFAGSFVGAIALVGVMVRAAPRTGPHAPRVSPDHAQALGRVLFAMIIFWAYMAFSQLLIYWIGDIPQEVAYYGRRVAGTWSDVTYLLVCGMLVVPFFALLSRRWKRDPTYLASVCAFVFLMHFVDVYWLVMPIHDRVRVQPHWLDAGAILFVGGLSCAWIVRRYASAPPLPLHDPELVAGIHYEAAV